MKVLIAHNHYGDHALGGEAMVFNAEAELLKRHGVEVVKYERTNSEINSFSPLQKIGLLINLHWSPETIRDAGKIMDRYRPDILHVHNYKYIITPSIFYAARKRNIKTVLTLHNYRLMVPCGNFMTREGNVCEECLNINSAKILYRRCAQGSILKSFLQHRLFYKTKNQLHQLIDLVDVYIVLSEFAKEKLEQTGVPADRIHVKPNFIEPLQDLRKVDKKERAVFVGRLSFEKGVVQLVENWKEINYPLFIIGSGPLEKKLHLAARGNRNIVFTGSMGNREVRAFLRESSFLLFPSTWFEGFGLTIVEAMSVGVPVVATDLGPRREVVADGITGFLYDPENKKEFIDKVLRLINDKDLLKRMGDAAKKKYQEQYLPDVSLKLLTNIYEKIM